MTNNSIFNSEHYKAYYKAITSDDNLVTRLLTMPDKYAVEVEDVQTLAEDCMRAVADYDYVRDDFFDSNAMDKLEEALENCGTTVYERLHHLHQMNFYLDRNTAKLAIEGANTTNLFNDHMKEVQNKPVNEEDLKSEIMKKITDINLSSKHISEFISQLKSHSDMSYTTAKLSKSSYEARCIATMDKYLRGNYSDIKEAAMDVCREADLQNVSQALTETYKYKKITEDILDFVIGFLFLTVYVCVVLGISFAATGIALAAVGFFFAAVVAGVAGVSLISHPECISDPVHMAAAKHRYNKNAEKIDAFNEFISSLDSDDDNIYDEQEEVTVLPF